MVTPFAEVSGTAGYAIAVGGSRFFIFGRDLVLSVFQHAGNVTHRGS